MTKSEHHVENKNGENTADGFAHKTVNNETINAPANFDAGVDSDTINNENAVGTPIENSTNALAAKELSTGRKPLTNDSRQALLGELRASERFPDKQLDNNLSTGLSTGFPAREANTALQNSNVQNTALQQCVESELDKYFALLEGHPPSDLYRLVISQVETALFSYVLELCGNNQSKAAEYLGVSRGTLRNRIVDLSLD